MKNVDDEKLHENWVLLGIRFHRITSHRINLGEVQGRSQGRGQETEHVYPWSDMDEFDPEETGVPHPDETITQLLTNWNVGYKVLLTE